MTYEVTLKERLKQLFCKHDCSVVPINGGGYRYFKCKKCNYQIIS